MQAFCKAITYLLSLGVEYLWLLSRIANLLKDGRLSCICPAYDENTKAVGLASNIPDSRIIV
jgi:hypothetical protein